MRPNDDEEVDSKGHKEEAKAKAEKHAVDDVNDHGDQIQDKADSAQNDPRHHQSGIGLERNQSQSKWKSFQSYRPSAVDEERGNSNIAKADDEVDGEKGEGDDNWRKSTIARFLHFCFVRPL